MWYLAYDHISVNVLLGVIDDYSIGSFLLPQRLTGESHLNFLQDEIPVLFEEITQQVNKTTLIIHRFVKVYTNRWIG